MASLSTQSVTEVHHWNESLFSFKTTRDQTLRFENGHFVMLGMEVDGKPLMRAYSIASPNYDEELEFLSIKVADGPLTSRLQNIQVGDELFVSSKPTGTLVADHLLDGRNLYLISTGTGLAPFISIIQDPEVYEKFDRIILTHGVRYTSELAYQEFITNQLPNNPFFGEEVREKLVYYPTVTREEFSTQGRLTNLMSSGKMFADIGLDKADPEHDRFMICGSPSMLKDTCDILDDWGFEESLRGIKGHYVVERAFVE
ncbi:MAG: ferredoxin--NADP reductase [Gammaproteobacteria bacterium]|nr:ferredoxin--NADP reductase [Gammaproteobacteria bacterium]MBT3860226.1 ferredoxin--NADP reductase [Gammaproteobacteria bacterium]MBT3987518.1 ferredoxin--NADP reductase [Gammaproteobacteria bacterium]MBT4256066.1 ferredoxin--NADP reductase [Gammaproteobacteria bacterium]MBT4581744.1 ferredoxin--NADP reductase [Gammaproteobacteria bacterium]